MTDRPLPEALARLSAGSARSPDFYRREAVRVLRRLPAGDANFRFFFFEILRLGRARLAPADLQEALSSLQKYTAHRFSSPAPADEPSALRDRRDRRKRR